MSHRAIVFRAVLGLTVATVPGIISGMQARTAVLYIALAALYQGANWLAGFVDKSVSELPSKTSAPASGPDPESANAATQQ